MNHQLRDSLFELYMEGGLELVSLGTHGCRRELIIDLETSALTPEKGEIIRYHAVNRWDEDDEFLEYARPREPLCDLAEEFTGITNAALAQCRLSSVVLDEFQSFSEDADLVGNDLDLGFGLRLPTA